MNVTARFFIILTRESRLIVFSCSSRPTSSLSTCLLRFFKTTDSVAYSACAVRTFCSIIIFTFQQSTLNLIDLEKHARYASASAAGFISWQVQLFCHISLYIPTPAWYTFEHDDSPKHLPLAWRLVNQWICNYFKTSSDCCRRRRRLSAVVWRRMLMALYSCHIFDQQLVNCHN